MSDQQIPDEAIAAQRAYDAADAEVQRIVALMPSNAAVLAGEADVPEELRAELQRARDARLARLEELLAVKRWEGDGGPVAAEKALRAAARG